ncbi:MAG: formylglycine-generating enzyme family protein [Deltaproteobacteria bacterium]|nr:formylglycine-generating enzyme family protein [Deltaproteobacteria bacterium]
MSKRPWLLSVVAALAGVLAAGVFMARDEAPPAPGAPRVRPAKPRGAPTPSALRPALIQIPDGTYTVGSPKEALTWEGPRRAKPYEPPQRQVTVSGLWMCETEVTQAQYQAVMGVNPSFCEEDCDEPHEALESPTRCQRDCTPDMPVNRVGWEDALHYLNRLTILESVALEAEGEPGLSQCHVMRGHDTYRVPGCTGFRLPTEDEWEIAARAGTTTSWAWGEDPAQADVYAWSDANSHRDLQRDLRREIRPVRGLAPNAWGLYDMAGNVNEWVWTPGPGGSAPSEAPPPRLDLEYAEEWLWNALIPGSSPVVLPPDSWPRRWRVPPRRERLAPCR